jgi:tetratricopeptide (TPR) repeat protein
VPPDVAAAAWLDKGEAQLAGGKFADAAESLKKAMAGTGPAAGVARVKLGLAHLHQARATAKTAPTESAAQFDLGLTLLTQAAGATADTPTGREAHQQALFELGKVLLSRQNLPEAEARFRQLVQTYPGGPQSGPGQLYLGSVLLLLARGDGTGRPPADADAKLAEAVKLFEGLANGADDYLKREGGIRLVNAVLLQQKYDEVPGLCDRLAQPYRGKVQELILLSMAYKAHEYARRPEKAAATRVQMEELFARLADSDFPGGTAEYTRAYWESQWFEPLRRASGQAATPNR